MIEAGADGFRLNFSHGDPETQEELVEAAREAIDRVDREIPLIQDLSGPRIRTTNLAGDLEQVELEEGQEVTFVPGLEETTTDRIGSNFPSLKDDLEIDDRVLVNEGLIQLRIHGETKEGFLCDVERGGVLGDHKGINLPDTTLNLPSLTEKDLNDLEAGRRMNFDIVMQSFVRCPEDVIALQEAVKDWEETPQLVAKIETAEVMEHLGDIARKIDLFLVARGDLGAEISQEDVPGVQKRIIRLSHRYDVGVITATQMLESMIERPVPTRAEVSDVSNAILDGTGSVMLSAETAVGKYPVETVETMHRVNLATEEDLYPFEASKFKIMPGWKPFIRASVRGGIKIAGDVDADAIGVFTRTGLTACLVSQLRPRAKILAFSHDQHIRRCLNIRWGIHPMNISYPQNLDSLLDKAEEKGVGQGLLSRGDVIVFIAGTKEATESENLVTIRKVRSEQG